MYYIQDNGILVLFLIMLKRNIPKCFRLGWLLCVVVFCDFSRGQYASLKDTESLTRTTQTSNQSISTTSETTTTVWKPPRRYNKYNYPSPLISPVECGLARETVGASVCDPSHELSELEVAELETILAEIREQSPCECNISCNEGFFPDTSIKGGIAIVPEMTSIYPLSLERVEGTTDYAEHLREHWWNLTCGDDFVIVVHVFEKKVDRSLGLQTKNKLSSDCETKIFDKHKKAFADKNYGKGLKALLIDYQKMLGGDSAPCEPSIILTVFTWIIVGGSSLAAVAFVLYQCLPCMVDCCCPCPLECCCDRDCASCNEYSSCSAYKICTQGSRFTRFIRENGCNSCRKCRSFKQNSSNSVTSCQHSNVLTTPVDDNNWVLRVCNGGGEGREHRANGNTISQRTQENTLGEPEGMVHDTSDDTNFERGHSVQLSIPEGGEDEMNGNTDLESVQHEELISPEGSEHGRNEDTDSENIPDEAVCLTPASYSHIPSQYHNEYMDENTENTIVDNDDNQSPPPTYDQVAHDLGQSIVSEDGNDVLPPTYDHVLNNQGYLAVSIDDTLSSFPITQESNNLVNTLVTMFEELTPPPSYNQIVNNQGNAVVSMDSDTTPPPTYSQLENTHVVNNETCDTWL